MLLFFSDALHSYLFSRHVNKTTLCTKYLINIFHQFHQLIYNFFLFLCRFTCIKSYFIYQTFPPEKAYELAKRLEIHYTPKYGSWLNIAEIELNTMTRQYLDRRIDDIHKLEEELSSYASLI